MAEGLTVPPLERLSTMASATPNLDALVLYGSRARGSARPDSDWDFGYLSGGPVDHAALLVALIEVLGTDRVDLVDLRRASGLLHFRAAVEGQRLFERYAGRTDRFRLEAAEFWFDAAPVLASGYEQVLAGLGR